MLTGRTIISIGGNPITSRRRERPYDTGFCAGGSLLGFPNEGRSV